MLDYLFQEGLYLSKKKKQCVYTNSASIQGPYNDPDAGFPSSRMPKDTVPRLLPVKNLDKPQRALVLFLFSKMGYE